MSTDDEFEATLRRRLADLAASGDADHDWADPLPVARERAAAGIAPDDDPAVVEPVPLRPPRRRWLPGLAVAAVLLAVVAGAGLGIHALAGSGTSGSAGSAGGAAVAGESSCAVSDCQDTAPGLPAPSSTADSGLSCPSQPGADCAPPTTCGKTTLASSGPLAEVAAIRPSGIVGPRTAPGGTAAVPYQLTFASSAGTAEIRPAQVLRTGTAQCSSAGGASPGAIEVVTAEPGAGASGSATFVAVDATGNPLPAGEYQVVIVIPYSVDGSALAQLVSPPVAVTVTS